MAGETTPMVWVKESLLTDKMRYLSVLDFEISHPTIFPVDELQEHVKRMVLHP